MGGLDPFVGARLYLAASARSDEVPQAIAAVVNSIYPGVGDQLASGEGQYREGMKQYGQLFMLPEKEMIPAMCALSSGLYSLSPDLVAGKLREVIMVHDEGGITRLTDSGIDRNVILRHCLITPSCGLGCLTTAQAEAILKLTRDVSKKKKKMI